MHVAEYPLEMLNVLARQAASGNNLWEGQLTRKGARLRPKAVAKSLDKQRQSP